MFTEAVPIVCVDIGVLLSVGLLGIVILPAVGLATTIYGSRIVQQYRRHSKLCDRVRICHEMPFWHALRRLRHGENDWYVGNGGLMSDALTMFVKVKVKDAGDSCKGARASHEVVLAWENFGLEFVHIARGSLVWTVSSDTADEWQGVGTM
jgi:hypothetical protein